MEQVYRDYFQQALSSCAVPQVDEQLAFFGHRMKVLQNLLDNEPAFQDFVRSKMKKILENYSGLYAISDKENATKVPMHVRMVLDNMVGGSLRQSLDIAIQSLIIQSFSFILRQLDFNFNIGTYCIPGNEEASRKLWLALFNCPSVNSFDRWTDSSVGGNAVVQAVSVKNTGIFGPAVCQFPFSYQIIQKLNNPSTRDQALKLKLDTRDTLQKICSDIFVGDIVPLMESFIGSSGEYISYFHDFVVTSATPVPGADKQITLKLYEQILRITRADSLRSFAGIHAGIWENEERLFRLGNLLANNLIPDNFRCEIFDSVASVPIANADSDNSPSSIEDHLACVDYCVLFNLLSSHWSRLHDKKLFESGTNLFAWVNEFSSITGDVELYLLSLIPYETKPVWRQDITLHTLREYFLRVKIVHIYVQEVLREMYITGAPVNCPVQLLTALEKPQVSSLEFFTKLVVSVPTEVEEYCPLQWVFFLRRYIQEIVFGEQSGFYLIASNHKAEPSLLNALYEVYDVCQNPLFSSLHENLSVRRTFLRCLLQVEFPLKLQSDEAQQLFLQHISDELADIEQWNSSLLSREDANIAITSEFQSVAALKSLARVQMAIRAYCYGIEKKREDQSAQSFLFDPLSQILEKSYEAQVYAFKVFKSIGGIESIGELICAEDKIHWLPFDTSMTASTKINLPDPFVWVSSKEIYEEVCGKIRFCVTRADVNSDSLQLIRDSSPEVITAAMYTQVTHDLGNSVINDTGLKVLRSWNEELSKNDDSCFVLRNWLLDGCPQFCEAVNISGIAGLCQLQVSIYLAIWASTHKTSWVHALFFDPQSHKESYLISMPDDEFAEIARISQASGWYSCPNGHKYSIGNCGMPMERSACPACGATIGGANHVAVRGVKRLTNEQVLAGSQKPGYQLDSNESTCIRLSAVALRVLRFILHTGLLFASSLSQENAKVISSLLSSNVEIDPFSFLSARVQEDWTKLRDLCKLGHGDLAVSLNIIVRSFFNNAPKGGTASLTCEEADLRKQIAEARSELEDANATTSIRLATGEIMWDDIHQNIPEGGQISLPKLMWRFREPVSYQHFLKCWTRQSQAQMSKFPVLGALVKEESRLETIRGIANVLAWHNILFSVIPHMSISRTDAIDLTNGDIINRLPAEEQSAAKVILEKYCAIFNSVLPRFEKLYECDDNPFLKDGKVDFGDGKQMDESTPVAFSLPSTVATGDSGNFINGVCTLRILESLVEAQNEVTESILLTKQRRSGNIPTLDAPQERKMPKVPAVSYLTPVAVLEKQLIIYNRENDLLPVLRMFSEQSLGYSEGYDLHYDFKLIESSLRNGLLSGKRPVNLCISHYQYRGDIHLMGQLTKLKSKLPQDSQLPNHLRENIASEIDTKNHALRLVQILELCIQFIVSVGSSNDQLLNGETQLETFVLETLELKEKWDGVTTRTISQHIRLRSIRALYEMLETLVKGNPLDDVPEKYCKKLTPAEEEKLRSSVEFINLGDLLAEFYDFITKIILPGEQKPESDLKCYLGCAGLEYEDW
eukprot:CAMPEP_0117064642 /NCGR_PEP_ID=MMETSP0472-20121206/45158_1 /TAXON_ID=693140 ORGANISM="Tiarina fusus, Strain LIS" /NCGR_SAMPLE_ID=MMETSP0472 /ASSEMBLY_ACC=CAM_ASM_000603 /LENGTH=1533 /DNA_ID=CAMNT_0004784887 /DNA_START=231 /DNA_END=4830 /DNA_ORIENTATION=+